MRMRRDYSVQNRERSAGTRAGNSRAFSVRPNFRGCLNGTWWPDGAVPIIASLPYENLPSKHLSKFQGAGENWRVGKFHLPRSRAITSSSTRMATTTSSANMRRSLN
jgi:hypothetical protein